MEEKQAYITKRSAGERIEKPAPTEKRINDVLALKQDATIADLYDAKRKVLVERDDYITILQREKMLDERYKAWLKNRNKFLRNEATIN